MRGFYDDCRIDGKPILIPDADVGVSKSDLDAEGSGRDESGYMHRIVLRERVRKWQFSYAVLCEDDYDYTERLFLGKPEFLFEYRIGTQKIKTNAYCSGISAIIHNSAKGLYKNVSFTIIEC
jgi:hypothetical protein